MQRDDSSKLLGSCILQIDRHCGQVALDVSAYSWHCDARQGKGHLTVAFVFCQPTDEPVKNFVCKR